MTETESGIVISFNELQNTKAYSPISLTESGIEIFSSALQPPKSWSGIFTLLLAKVIFFKESQPEKGEIALASEEVIDAGSSIEVRESQL